MYILTYLSPHVKVLTVNHKGWEEETLMPGTSKGAKKAAAKNKELYGADFYARIGRDGGRKSRNGGFAANRELAREAGRKGGRISRRPKATSIDTPKAA